MAKKCCPKGARRTSKNGPCKRKGKIVAKRACKR